MNLPSLPRLDAPLPGAAHFTLGELIASQTARAYHLDNTPPPPAMARLLLLAQVVLEPLRQRFGPIKITSGYRSPELNWHVSLSRKSRHCTGQAADLRPLAPGVATPQMALWAQEHLPCSQIILYNPPLGWMHLDLASNGVSRARLHLHREGVGPMRIGRNDLLLRYSAEPRREEMTP
jgi:hypothetical protein